MSFHGVQRAGHCLSLRAEHKNTERDNIHGIDRSGKQHHSWYACITIYTHMHMSAYQCTCTHANTRTHFLGGDGIQYVLRAAVLLCRLAATFVMVVLLFHIKQNATALHTAPLISASVPQPFIIASHPLLLSSPNVALIAALHQAVLLRMIQASPG